MNPAAQDFAERLVRVEKGVKKLQRAGVDLGSSSIEDGQLNEYDIDGQLGSTLGKQFDGTHGAVTVSGPVPPTPTLPLVVVVPGGIEVGWGGSFAGGETVQAPLDFARVEVHVSTDPGLTADYADTIRQTIETPRGGVVYVPADPALQLYVRLVTRALSGKRSPATATAGPFSGSTIPAGYLDVDLESIGGNTIYAGPDEPTGEHKTGDLWLKEVDAGPPPEYQTNRWDEDAWKPVLDQGVSNSLAAALAAQEAADSKTRVYTQPDEPTGLGADDTGLWLDSDDGNRPRTWNGTQWVDKRFGNAAIAPQSLVASNVIATGTVTAALLESVIVLATTIIAGDPSGTHARMTPTGFRVYREDLVDGVPDEVVRLGVNSTNDYLGVVDATGQLIASMDDTGGINGRTANFREEIFVKGRTIAQIANATRNHVHGYAFSGGSNITTEIGLTEIAAPIEPDRLYELGMSLLWNRDNASGDVVFRLRFTNNGDTPRITSEMLAVWSTSGTDVGKWSTFQARTFAKFLTAGTYRFLLTAQRQGGGTIQVNTLPEYVPTVVCLDHGPHTSSTVGSVNRGGGTTAPVVQQYDTGDMAPAGSITFRGDGSTRTDVPDRIIQGWDPSGYNGNGYGYLTWNLPNITGTVNRVDVYLYAEHWYSSSGGLVAMNMPSSYGSGFAKITSDWITGGWPKPGGKWVTVPEGWFPYFRSASNPRAIGISIGRGSGSDLNYYGRFVASASRLRIWYTQ